MTHSTRKELFKLNSIEEDLTEINSIISIISNELDLVKCKRSVINKIAHKLNQFNSLQDYNSVQIHECYKVIHDFGEFYFLILTFASNVERMVGRNQKVTEEIQEFSFAGYGNLSNSFPRTFIRPETFIDKVHEVISPIEIDFKMNKSFSKNFYVLTEDEAKLRTVISEEFLSSINKYKKIELELFNKNLLVRTRSRTNKIDATRIINLIGRLQKT